GRSRDLARAEPPPPTKTESKFDKEFKTYATMVAPAKAAQPETGQAQGIAAKVTEQTPAETPAPEVANRKLIRNATVELEIVSFDDAVQKITAFANEERGYVATTNSQKQANGKLRGQVIVKVLPENLDRFLQKVRGLGELKKQMLGTNDGTKRDFDAAAS